MMWTQCHQILLWVLKLRLMKRWKSDNSPKIIVDASKMPLSTTPTSIPVSNVPAVNDKTDAVTSSRKPRLPGVIEIMLSIVIKGISNK